MLLTVFILIMVVAFCLALFGILMTHIKAIVTNCRKWKEKEDSSLTYSYFCGTGQFQRIYIYKDAHTLLGDKTWLLISAAGAADHIGKNKPEEKIPSFFLSLIQIPLMAIGYVEMLFRVTIGSVYLWVVSIFHWAILAILECITSMLIPVSGILDRGMRTEQHCPHCYRTFTVPVYVCPSCGKKHKDLIPGKTGILTARCECGQFLPCALFSGSSGLDSVCPECGKPLAATGAREFTLQMLGGNTSGKTAYLAAFQQVYRTVNENNDKVKLQPFPKEQFDELERMFINGVVSESSKTSIVTYSIVHNYSNGNKDNLVIYDIPDEVLISGVYEQNPLNFAYTNGILIVFDPTSIKAVRKAGEEGGEEIPVGSYSSDEAEIEDVIVEFIQQFSRICNLPSNRRVKTPVAVIINKSDLKVVKDRIGKEAVLYRYKRNPEEFDNDISVAQSKICRDYIMSLGMANTIYNLESVFSNIKYFPVSAMGHVQREGMPFAPAGVIEPIAWIVNQNNFTLTYPVPNGNP